MAKAELVLTMDGPLAKKIDEIISENSDLKCQIRILREKLENAEYLNKLQMTEIVKYRRLIEHYEDGAPNYVLTQ